MLAVRSSADHYNQPHVFMTSEKLADFFTTSFNATLSDVAVCLEGFCLSGIPGLLRHSQDAILQLKASISALILRKLRETAGTQVSRMYYVNFEQHITDKYGVVLKNWPLEKFCSPSVVNSRTELDVLLCAWNTNATLFHRLSTEELEKWRQGRFERQMEDMVERVYDGAMTNTMTVMSGGTDTTSATPGGSTDTTTVTGGSAEPTTSGEGPCGTVTATAMANTSTNSANDAEPTSAQLNCPFTIQMVPRTVNLSPSDQLAQSMQVHNGRK
ncbi:hypothetical protein SCP_0605880 [Sparassis crispa]|uniref:Uncharacterized protein n=1 Tax=Sparassis crispa TaxID=139825 RepID=A0A401GR14_9APHY|nr:hypothetical protein SCP_0605880 [Sparassis crispa]GBE84609.1 hypothetical protein SCP_0605880 [Sparassis crispa]